MILRLSWAGIFAYAGKAASKKTKFLKRENLVKIYSKSNGSYSVIFNNVNLTVGEDECIPVISYLEAGKSTLLKIVTDLEEVTFGSVRLNGKEIDKPASLGSNGVSPILFIMMKS